MRLSVRELPCHARPWEVVWPRPGSPIPPRIENAELRCAWGLAISWNDGHDTGISPSSRCGEHKRVGTDHARQRRLVA